MVVLLVLVWSRAQGPYHGMGVGAVNTRHGNIYAPVIKTYYQDPYIKVIGPTGLEGTVQIIICGLWYFCLRGGNFLAVAPGTGIMVS